MDKGDTPFRCLTDAEFMSLSSDRRIEYLERLDQAMRVLIDDMSRKAALESKCDLKAEFSSRTSKNKRAS